MTVHCSVAGHSVTIQFIVCSETLTKLGSLEVLLKCRSVCLTDTQLSTCFPLSKHHLPASMKHMSGVAGHTVAIQSGVAGDSVCTRCIACDHVKYAP